LNYWRHGDYLGIGAGAHGKITDVRSDRVIRTVKIRKPESYLSSDPQSAEFREQQDIAPEDRPLEFVMNQLRLREGFPESLFPERTGLAIEVLEPALSACVREELLNREDGCIRCTERGWNFLDEILRRFVR
jgi:oxygen-independent coproporphyrinogen-3 oxidase